MNSPNDRLPYKILSANDLYIINEEVTGYTAFVRDKQLLHSAVKRPYLILFGEEQFPSVYEKAAATLHSLAYHHIFADGNKRTAARATQLFLESNGIQVTWTASEIYDFVLQVAKGEIDLETIVAWLQAHSESFSP